MESIINLLINLNISITPYSLGYIVDYSSDELEELIDDSGENVSLDEE